MPAWKGEVVHPGAPESQCVYRIRFYRILSVLSLYEIHRIKATDVQETGWGSYIKKGAYSSC
jgi:hypothetical protein